VLWPDLEGQLVPDIVVVVSKEPKGEVGEERHIKTSDGEATLKEKGRFTITTFFF